MTVTVLMDIPLRADTADVDAAFLHDLPATAGFPGNELTEVLSDESRPGTLTLLTRWASGAAYDEYVAWRRTPEGATRLPDIAAGPPSVRRFSSRLSFDET
ncbi:putative quinol monooxygenase [Rathayibacter tanaceti]|uniref:Monooxygenase n=2 Tax=Rathayibacter tanaceti TaxID=1671680 RepID=A0A162G056_9MICO|nr:antibiotic biosynthesis monooxygenase family protein [Rathayibacter tanaceti]KZX22160.1 hypothetical protein ACH61_00727 [Rathayibacter tanaceti]QHC54459.1 monooxygenase [Rathayibacter tanaceti]TCO35055.1 quinol monooxygenase YgiN [Rathayibacter tanaceti]